MLQPFEEDDEEAARNESVQHYGEVACQFYPCWENIEAEEEEEEELKHTCWCEVEFLGTYFKKCADGSSEFLWTWIACQHLGAGPPV